MQTLTVGEAARDLAALLKRAVAGEEIGIRSETTVVALRPVPATIMATDTKTLAPLDALRRLQQDACLTPGQAESYLNEVHAERLAAEKRAA